MARRRGGLRRGGGEGGGNRPCNNKIWKQARDEKPPKFPLHAIFSQGDSNPLLHMNPATPPLLKLQVVVGVCVWLFSKCVCCLIWSQDSCLFLSCLGTAALLRRSGRGGTTFHCSPRRFILPNCKAGHSTHSGGCESISSTEHLCAKASKQSARWSEVYFPSMYFTSLRLSTVNLHMLFQGHVGRSQSGILEAASNSSGIIIIIIKRYQLANHVQHNQTDVHCTDLHLKIRL